MSIDVKDLENFMKRLDKCLRLISSLISEFLENVKISSFELKLEPHSFTTLTNEVAISCCISISFEVSNDITELSEVIERYEDITKEEGIGKSSFIVKFKEKEILIRVLLKPIYVK